MLIQRVYSNWKKSFFSFNRISTQCSFFFKFDWSKFYFSWKCLKISILAVKSFERFESLFFLSKEKVQFYRKNLDYSKWVFFSQAKFCFRKKHWLMLKTVEKYSFLGLGWFDSILCEEILFSLFCFENFFVFRKSRNWSFDF